MRKFVKDQYFKLGLAAFGLNVIFKGFVWVTLARRISFHDAFIQWDSDWYMRLARHGYPSKEFLDATHFRTQSATGYFPFLSLLIRGFHDITRISFDYSGAIVAIGFSIACFVALAQLLSKYFEYRTVQRILVLLALSPGAFVFTMVYTEGLFLFLIAGFFLSLRKQSLLLASAFAAAAVITRPNGLLVFPIAFAYWWQFKRPKDWRWLPVLVAPAISFGAFLLYHRVHSGTALAYFKNQDLGWGLRFNFGRTTAHVLPQLLTNTSKYSGRDFSAEFAIVMIVLSILLIREKIDWGIKLYAWGIVAMTIGSSFVSSYPRMLTMGFPLFIPLGTRLAKWQPSPVVSCACIIVLGLVAFPVWSLILQHRLIP